MRALAIVGTRPEAIKMAPVVQELTKRAPLVESLLCVTAQHREMLDQVLAVFNLRPDLDLNLMVSDQQLSDFTAKAVVALTEVLKKVHPNVVIVQGDTTTAMVGTLVAFYQQIPVAHVEAGLRSWDLYNPFPEEVNRRLIDVMATFHFAPTQAAARTLRAEGISKEGIFVTGNTVVDALLWGLAQKMPGDVVTLLSEMGLRPRTGDRNPASGEDGGHRLLLVTAHRRENFGAPLEEICVGIQELVRREPKLVVVYPVHLNPNVQDPVYRILAGEPRVFLINPLSYLSFLHLMNQADFVLTDSGGIQEEAPVLGKPVLVLRQKTERPEGVKAGVTKVVGFNADQIVRESESLLRNSLSYTRMARRTSPYGDGHAAKRIVKILTEVCQQGPLAKRLVVNA